MDMILSWLQTGFYTVIPFVILLGILIFVHELGHFLVARWCGVRVETFSLGFGKKIFSLKKGDTTYCISIIPLGGYVKMFGEQPGEEIAEDQKPFSFSHKTVWQRIAVVLAGPLMNFFFAILVLAVVAITGEKAKTPVLGDIEPHSPAYSFGFRSGDTLKQLQGKNIQTYEDVAKVLNQAHGKEVSFEVIRENTGEAVAVKAPVVAKPNPNVLSTEEFVGEIEGFNLSSASTFVGLPDSSPLTKLGLKTGDKVKAVNGVPTKYWRELQSQLQQASTSSPLVLDVLRDTESFTVTVAQSKLIKAFTLEALKLESAELYLSEVIDKSPAQDAGLQKDDRILSINGQNITSWSDVVNNIKSFSGEGLIKIQIARADKVLAKEIKPQLTTQMGFSGTEEKRYTIGIKPYVNITDPEFMVVKTNNPFTALARGIDRSWSLSVMTVMSFVRLIQNKISPKNIGGVISIGQAASESFKMGLEQFLQMMALISINLFILNLLPIPILDGGHLVFYSIEAIKGSPLSLKKMAIAQQVGLILLMSLMLFALFNDFTRVFGFM